MTKPGLKAITLHRPWGYAIAHLGKDIENRTWNCWLPTGSLLAIHNGQKWDKAGVEFIKQLGLEPPTQEEDKAGGIIAIVRFQGNITQSDSHWFFGPVGWQLSDVVPVEPVFCKGSQGLWSVPEGLLPELRMAYVATAGWKEVSQ